MSLYDNYKPLRNNLRRLELFDSLYVIWAYAQHLQFGNPFPDNIQVWNKFVNNATEMPRETYLSPWDLETLTRELILHAPIGNNLSDKSLRKWDNLANTKNKFRELENQIGAEFVNKDNILMEMFRIAHRQFLWQIHPSQIYMYRYYRIFGSEEMGKIVENKLGVTTYKLHLVGTALLGHFLGSNILRYPIRVEIPSVNADMLKEVIALSSSELENIREKLQGESTLDEKFSYANYALRAHPLIKTKIQGQDVLICPLPTLLYWRYTSGLYYELYNENGFDNAFGGSFQNYVGEVLRKANPNQQVIPSMKFDKTSKETIDWILSEDESALFIECKMKRLPVPVKMELNNTGPLDGQLDTITNIILQVYKTIKDYKENKYPNFPYQKDRVIFPLILTLEDWYWFPDVIEAKLNTMLEDKFKASGIPIEWLDEIPYSLCSINEFENMAQIINKVGIKNFMDKKLTNKEKRRWHFGPFMVKEFPKEYSAKKFLFEKEFNNEFPVKGSDVV